MKKTRIHISSYPYTLDVICGPNPLEGFNAWAHNSGGGFVQETFDLTPFEGNVVSIRFHVGWDCGNCSIEKDGILMM